MFSNHNYAMLLILWTKKVNRVKKKKKKKRSWPKVVCLSQKSLSCIESKEISKKWWVGTIWTLGAPTDSMQLQRIFYWFLLTCMMDFAGRGIYWKKNLNVSPSPIKYFIILNSCTARLLYFMWPSNCMKIRLVFRDKHKSYCYKYSNECQ